MNVDEFWALVERSHGCWEWQGKRMPSGYGYAYVRGMGQAGTHRIAFILTYGHVLPGMVICHKCDNPPCCRPDHLFVGSSADNSRDMIRKGRGPAKNGFRPKKRVPVIVLAPNAPLTVVDLSEQGRHIVYRGETLCGHQADPSWPVITPPYLAYWQKSDCRHCLHGLENRDRGRKYHRWEKADNPYILGY